MKYQDFVPHLLSVGDCQEKIQSALKAGNAKIKKVQGTLVSMESNVNKAMVMIFWFLCEHTINIFYLKDVFVCNKSKFFVIKVKFRRMHSTRNWASSADLLIV